MGTIEKAREYARNGMSLCMDTSDEQDIYCEDLIQAYLAGSEDERKGLTKWHDIETDKDGFATSESLDAIFDKIPCLVKDSRSGEIELIDYDNASEWRGDMERKPTRYRWREIHE